MLPSGESQKLTDAARRQKQHWNSKQHQQHPHQQPATTTRISHSLIDDSLLRPAASIAEPALN